MIAEALNQLVVTPPLRSGGRFAGVDFLYYGPK